MKLRIKVFSQKNHYARFVEQFVFARHIYRSIVFVVIQRRVSSTDREIRRRIGKKFQFLKNIRIFEKGSRGYFLHTVPVNGSQWIMKNPKKIYRLVLPFSRYRLSEQFISLYSRSVVENFAHMKA